MKLTDLGWSSFFEEKFSVYVQSGHCVGRVAAEYRHLYGLLTASGEVLAQVSGKMRHQSAGRGDFPTVGDWVVIEEFPGDKAMIHAVLPRKSKFSRKVAGNEFEEQIVAANVDLVFLVMSLNQDFNLRRLERYLVVAWESGSTPVVILSKSDLCDDLDEKVAQVQSIAVGVPIHVISSIQQQGLEALSLYLVHGQTVALLGSSGVGKSTLINTLLGKEVQRVHEVRENDARGRHTTTNRELFLLPEGGIIIDTPGMRELHFWEGDHGFDTTFTDIQELADKCFFNDCRHQQEPGCAVQQAITAGLLDLTRLDSYRNLQREIAITALNLDKKQLRRAENKRRGRASYKSRRSRIIKKH